MYLPTVRGYTRIWSFSKSSSAIRSSPQVGFSAAIRQINRLNSAARVGLPNRPVSTSNTRIGGMRLDASRSKSLA